MSVRVDEAHEEFEALLDYVRRSRGFDFAGYKRPSLLRRVGKRMQEVDVEVGDFTAYEEYLASHPDEFVNLFNTILINVTGFFRDTAAWQVIADEIVPRIVQPKSRRDPIRVWSTGCASGEEAYTLAMLFAEALGEDAFREQVKIYATDVDEDALQEGRQGTYPAKRVQDVPPELRERYFTAAEGRHHFRPDLRRCVIFGRHDLLQDPPISHVDLLVSRNTLMYFRAEAQEKILASFHFGLEDDGYLFLGKSEALVSRSSLFSPVDNKRRVFRKQQLPNRERLLLVPGGRTVADTRAEAERAPQAIRAREAAFEAAPVAHVIVDLRGALAFANLQARVLFGLSPADAGSPLQELPFSRRPLELRPLMEQAHRERRPVSERDVEWRTPSGSVHYLEVQFSPLTGDCATVVGTGITFTDVTRYRRLQESVEQQRRELERAYEEVQQTAEEFETTNEELQSTNEELETTNEELQSTNEELETMNEELQSTNEELETLNNELRQRTDELNETNLFLETILRSLTTGVAVVDADFRVEAWNSKAFELWGLRREEVEGRNFLNLDIGLPVDEVKDLIRSSLSGEDGIHELTVPAVNRRGKQIECRVACSPLHDPLERLRGAIVLMEECA